MNDKELLTLAAKAAGYKVRWVDTGRAGVYRGFKIETGEEIYSGIKQEVQWNPLTNDRDAFRLAVKLGMAVDIDIATRESAHSWAMASADNHAGFAELHNGDPFAATRLAIVRAAAEIGRAMP